MPGTSNHRRMRAPSPAMIVALVALIFAMSGTAVAATKLVSGDSLIKKDSLSRNRLRTATVTGRQVDAATLGKVPSAARADRAAPSGAAGGDLAGSYPDPTIAKGAVDASKLGAIPCARVHNSTAEVVPTGGSWTSLAFDAVDFDVGGLRHASQLEPLYAPVAGKYLVVASVLWEGNASGVRFLELLRNGSTLDFDTAPGINGIRFGGASSAWQAQRVETVCQLDAGDYVHVGVWQDSGSSLNVVAASDGDNHLSPVFSTNWIAP